MHDLKMKKELAKVKIHRRALKHVCRFCEVFEGFEKIPAVKSLFGDKTTRIISTLMVAEVKGDGYMWVDQYNRRLVLSVDYLKKAPKVDLYLDAIHELVHVKQMRNGRDLFDKKRRYIDRPTEIEAYRTAAREAKRLGMGKRAVKDYIRVFWMSDGELNLLYKRISSQR